MYINAVMAGDITIDCNGEKSCIELSINAAMAGDITIDCNGEESCTISPSTDPTSLVLKKQ